MTLLSDEVWRQLDPEAGRLSGRAVRWLRWSVGGVLAVALLVGLGWRAGVVVPRLGTPNSWESVQIDGNRIEYLIHVVNNGWTSAEVLAVGRSGPGLVLEGIRAQLPVTLRPGDQLDAVLLYRVTDCAAVPAQEWPVPVTVKRTWGTVTGFVLPPTMIWPGASQGMREYTGADPSALQWQRGAADLSCHPS